MKKKYTTPEMEILDTELEGVILGASQTPQTPVKEPGQGGQIGARQGGLGFDEDEEDF